MPIHNEAKLGEIAKTVLMPGDPLRAKYIAEKYLEDCKVVNQLRGMYTYTGKYKGVEITVMPSGMGMPSMGIYAYELYDYYKVENIIRIGTCGVFDERAGLLDVLLVDKSYNEGNYSNNYNDEDVHLVDADAGINNLIVEVSKEINIPVKRTNIACTECFDAYQPNRAKGYVDRMPKDANIVGTEMESFALYYIAKLMNKKASCLLSVVDTNYPNGNNDKIVSPEDRQTSLDDMIKLAIEAAIRL
jgi:purine-nucleoside phosphorylase